MARVCALIAVLALAGCAGETQPQSMACPETAAQEYLACGCGCCGGTEPTVVCIEDLDRCLSQVIAEDQSARASPGCRYAGCALGVSYVRCTAPME